MTHHFSRPLWQGTLAFGSSLSSSSFRSASSGPCAEDDGTCTWASWAHGHGARGAWILDIKDMKRVQRNTLKPSCRDLHGKFNQYHKSRCILTLMQFMWHNLSSQVTSHCLAETSLSLFGCVFLWPPWTAMDLLLSFRAALTQLMHTKIAKASGMTVPSMFVYLQISKSKH